MTKSSIRDLAASVLACTVGVRVALADDAIGHTVVVRSVDVAGHELGSAGYRLLRREGGTWHTIAVGSGRGVVEFYGLADGDYQLKATIGSAADQYFSLGRLDGRPSIALDGAAYGGCVSDDGTFTLTMVHAAAGAS
ncbi:hypothetical protein [Bifidobacterium cuniculi]|uniref:Uncharacterized protein n=1 Tax=Bifidobacterium cuniculi TaxID=1688 RepID=A0A087B0K5_9BIFI|nr:hypothetical protein [Bifidobacterium cuniculi]KFI64555.1 hypothetical protein BCUN_2008 [Bifidobacterium cuniculi]